MLTGKILPVIVPAKDTNPAPSRGVNRVRKRLSPVTARFSPARIPPLSWALHCHVPAHVHHRSGLGKDPLARLQVDLCHLLVVANDLVLHDLPYRVLTGEEKCVAGTVRLKPVKEMNKPGTGMIIPLFWCMRYLHYRR